ncbi:probable splicing factor, arginine/serine-rich 7 isoform X5 [Pomacea canaliculata]|uniref:probable splicing factor, arginine/serine-rich 7 isoform X5 n=1 Tax=Pomacea canaliculata TaxID=400727 RepID=UPI000D73F425|nr:probable splicing factor, arginine/serine-rich 7 isoform X5 [Pomacea canaliculata]
MSSKLETRVIQVSNVAPATTKEQLKTLFGFLGRIRECKVFPPDGSDQQVTAKVCYVEYEDSTSAGVSLHLTNTVFIDRALIVVPVMDGKIPDERVAMQLTPQTVSRMSAGQPAWPSNVVSQVCGTGINQMITTYDPRLNALGLPQYPPLAATLDAARVEEIRRTVYVGNLDPKTTAESLITYFSQVGEVKYVRMAGDETGMARSAYIEFTDQRSVATCLTYGGTMFGGRPISVSHAMTNISKPLSKSQEASRREMEEAMKKVKEAQALISAAAGEKSSRSRSRSRRRSGSRSRHSRSTSRSRRSRSRSRGRRRRSRSHRRSRSPRRVHRTRSRSRRRRSRSRSGIVVIPAKERRSRSRDRRRSRSRSKPHRRSKSGSRSRRPSRTPPRAYSTRRSRSNAKEKENVVKPESDHVPVQRKSGSDATIDKKSSRKRERSKSPARFTRRRSVSRSPVKSSRRRSASRSPVRRRSPSLKRAPKSKSRSPRRSRSPNKKKKIRSHSQSRRSRSGSRHRSKKDKKKEKERSRSRDRKDKEKEKEKDKERKKKASKDRKEEKEKEKPGKVTRDYDEEEKGYNSGSDAELETRSQADADDDVEDDRKSGIDRHADDMDTSD